MMYLWFTEPACVAVAWLFSPLRGKTLLEAIFIAIGLLLIALGWVLISLLASWFFPTLFPSFALTLLFNMPLMIVLALVIRARFQLALVFAIFWIALLVGTALELAFLTSLSYSIRTATVSTLVWPELAQSFAVVASVLLGV